MVVSRLGDEESKVALQFELGFQKTALGCSDLKALDGRGVPPSPSGVCQFHIHSEVSRSLCFVASLEGTMVLNV